MKITGYIGVFILLGLYSCEKEGIGPVNVNSKDYSLIDTTESVFIINEGNFQWGNSSITHYSVKTNEVTQEVFKGVNGRSLGDIAQSMEVYNGKGYIVVNNSNRIEVVDLNTFELLGTIDGLVAPRYIQIIDSAKAYVTDLYADYVAIFNPETYQVIGQVDIEGFTEEMEMTNDKVYITNVDTSSISGDRLYIVDANSDAVLSSLELQRSPGSIVLDKDNKLWILSSGGYQEELPKLVQIDPLLDKVIREFTFNSLSMSPNKLVINGEGNMLYFLNGGVFKMSIYDLELPQVETISSEGHLFYGLGVDPVSGDVYLADAVDYVQSGTIYVHDGESGSMINSFPSGIIPGNFAFK
ncbi:MAG: YncE family protein [Flavobacteriales bacterium]|nr:YncE family protein [Flavobacteriales bacterium]